ncbi:hypothetical protein [Stenotrophomonas sp. ATs4]|uniref:hypothetical protein n=1 Tax=Stenotrophomonas sp. ATs4 TaxID=3402766 RepID=UPI003F6F99C2
MSNDIKSELPQTTIRLLVNKYGLISGLRFNEHSPDLVFGQPEVVRIKANGGVVIAEGAELEDAARAFWDVVAEWRGDGSRPTLADAQPGGRLRLGDQAERARFEAWHCEKFKTSWQTGAPTRDMHNGVYADNYGPDEEQVRWEAWQAALSAQPSPGGQGDAITPAMVDAAAAALAKWAGHDDGSRWVHEARDALAAALAARQPVEIDSESALRKARLALAEQCEWGSEKRACLSGELDSSPAMKALISVCATPPAQAVDLGTGVAAIADERQRQLQAEGFTREKDQQYRRGELAKAATAYVQLAAMDLETGTRDHIAWHGPPAVWPWAREWWKPVDARRDLVRAGALIAAQIDLIDSLAVQS